MECSIFYLKVHFTLKANDAEAGIKRNIVNTWPSETDPLHTDKSQQILSGEMSEYRGDYYSEFTIIIEGLEKKSVSCVTD